jgi:hypothetical protein
VAAVSVATLAALAAGCGQGRPDPTDASASGPAGATASPSPTGSATAGPAPAANFCQVGLPAQWQRALGSGKLGQAAGTEVVVHAVGPDGRSAVVEKDSAAGREVDWVTNAANGAAAAVHPVMRLAHPATDQLFGAATDGRYLVFSVSHDPSSTSTWTLYSWDSRAGGAPRQLAANATDASGQPVNGPMLYPVVYDGVASWTAGTPAGTTELHRYDLAGGADSVVRSGHPADPFLLGGLLVWPESAAPDALTALHAVAAGTGSPAALPGPVAAVTGPAFISGGDSAGVRTVAWATADVRSLYAWRAGWAAPVKVLSVPEGRAIQWVRVAGPLVAWDDGTAQWAADLRTGTYTQLTPRYGYTEAAGDGLGVGYAPDGKAGGAPAPTVVRATDLPALPSCR